VRRITTAVFATVLLAGVVACGDDGPTTVRLVTYDSFPTKDTPLNDALAEFTRDTGIGVEIVVAGDAGTMVTKAALTSGNPEGDVMWGVDNTLLSAATDADVFDGTPAEVDHGDVCVNYDRAWFAERGIDPPVTLDDLVEPQFRDLLVVQDATASSPGLAFLLATIARYGEDGWQQYWRDLVANGVEVADSWSTAYYERFSGAAGSEGDRPLVVSYGTSPPAEVVFSDPPIDPATGDAPTGVSEGTCFRQVEYAGVLRGTDHADAAERLLEFLTGERFQRELPLTLFVYPANDAAELPAVFTRFAVSPAEPFTLDPAAIEANRTTWQEQWSAIAVG
jgi:thiamine transport system substrate-binding protein